MADNTKIEWTDATWNPITGCTLVDEGCRNCYAARLAATRLKHLPSREGLAKLNADGVAKFTGEVRFDEKTLTQPMRWKRPRRIFVCAHGDLFHESVPDDWIDHIFAVMGLAPQHTFQVLTKRPERAAEYLSGERDRRVAGKIVSMATRDMALLRKMTATIDTTWPVIPEGDPEWPDGLRIRKWPLSNVWLGTSIHDQASADLRIPHLLKAPAAVRFISAEPLLGPVDLKNVKDDFGQGQTFNALSKKEGIAYRGTGIDWVIVGGESGPKARPMHPEWARSLRDQCAAAGVAFLFKQWGEWGHALHMAGVTGVSAALARTGHWAHPHRYRIHGGPEDGQCFESLPQDHLMLRIGKKAAGRLLDGVEHNGFPESDHA